MDGVGAVSARAAKRARKAAREAEEAKAESERAQEIEQIKAEAMKELQAENDRLKTHNGELEAKIEQLKAENEQLKEGCGRRGVPHTPVPGAPVQRPRLLGDLELMNLLGDEGRRKLLTSLVPARQGPAQHGGPHDWHGRPVLQVS